MKEDAFSVQREREQERGVAVSQRYTLPLDLLLPVLASHQQPSDVWTTVLAESLPPLKGRIGKGPWCQVLYSSQLLDGSLTLFLLKPVNRPIKRFEQGKVSICAI